MKKIQRLGGRTAAGTVVAVVLGGVAACGDGFGGEESCKASHTCPTPTEGDGGEGGGTNTGGGKPSNEKGGADNGAAGEAPTPGASGSSEPPAECSLPADCSNADPSDGIETCFNGKCVPGNPPPTVVSVVPKDEAVDVEPDGSIVIAVSEPLEASTVTTQTVQVLDGGKVIAGKVIYADTKITFEPEKPLALLAPYTVAVSSAVTDVDGAALAQPFTSTFKVRDGSWSVTTVVAGNITELSPTLQLNDAGDALVAWMGQGEQRCPATARWFNRGAALGAAKTFSNGRDNYCRNVHAAVSANGHALLSWLEEGNNTAMATAEFRDGKWGGATARGVRYDSSSALGIASDGTMHYLSPEPDVQVWQTTPAGVWSANGQVVSPRRAINAPALAVAANGDAVAAWGELNADDVQNVVAARFAHETAKWSTAVSLPGSVLGGGEAPVRGVPQVAFDDANVPVVVWRRDAELVATHLNATQNVWSGPQPISGDVTGLVELQYYQEPPALVFDGRSFVVAFTAQQGSDFDNYVVRYDREQQSWRAPERVSTNAARGTIRMPRLTADGHGNLLVVWAKPQSTGVYNFVYQRFDAAADSWSGPLPIASASMTNAELGTGIGRMALGGNASGLAAFTFSDVVDWPSKLQLASFY
jgi:Bacterial Ig-like domain